MGVNVMLSIDVPRAGTVFGVVKLNVPGIVAAPFLRMELASDSPVMMGLAVGIIVRVAVAFAITSVLVADP